MFLCFNFSFPRGYIINEKLSLAVLASLMLAACTADVYSDKGNATFI